MKINRLNKIEGLIRRLERVTDKLEGKRFVKGVKEGFVDNEYIENYGDMISVLIYEDDRYVDEEGYRYTIWAVIKNLYTSPTVTFAVITNEGEEVGSFKNLKEALDALNEEVDVLLGEGEE